MSKLRRFNRRRLQMHGFGKGVEKAPKRPRKRISLLRPDGAIFHFGAALAQGCGKRFHHARELAGLGIVNDEHFGRVRVFGIHVAYIC